MVTWYGGSPYYGARYLLCVNLLTEGRTNTVTGMVVIHRTVTRYLGTGNSLTDGHISTVMGMVEIQRTMTRYLFQKKLRLGICET